jgi:MFS family permease
MSTVVKESSGMEFKLQGSRDRWFVLFSAVFGFFLFNYVLQSVPPLLNEFQVLFGISKATAGLLISVVVVPGIFLALPAGLLIGKHGFRMIGFLSALLLSVGSFVTAFSSTFALALLGRLIAGLGGCFLTIGAAVIIPQWFQPKEIGKAMGFYVAGTAIAVTVTFFTTPVLAQNYGWQIPFYLGGIASIISAGFFLAIMKDGPYKNIVSTSDKLVGLKQAFGNSEIWKLGMVWMLFNMVVIGFLTWAPVMFVTFKGLNIVDASILASSVMVVNLFLIPFYGWVSDRINKRRPFIIVGATATAFGYFAISFSAGIPLIAAILFSAAAAGAVPGMVMALAARTLPPKQAGISFGLMTMWQYIGITITAPLVGYILQVSESMFVTFASLAMFSVIIAALVLSTKCNS